MSATPQVKKYSDNAVGGRSRAFPVGNANGWPAKADEERPRDAFVPFCLSPFIQRSPE